jgi:uncharacterized membrane protein
MKAKQIAYLVMVSLVFFSLAVPVLAHEGDDYYNHHGMMSGFSGMGWFGMGFGWIFMILIVVALVLFIVWLIKQIQEPKRRR